MKEKKWELINSEVFDENLLFEVCRDTLINPRTDQPVTITVLKGNDAANVVPITKEGEVILIKQYRFGISRPTIEVPGGMVDDGEAQQAAVARELQEETGYSSNNWTYLGKIPANPVFQDAYIHHWLATDVELTHDLKLDDAEDISVVKMPLEKAVQALKDGTFEHPHTVNALLRAFLKLGKI